MLETGNLKKAELMKEYSDIKMKNSLIRTYRDSFGIHLTNSELTRCVRDTMPPQHLSLVLKKRLATKL